MGVSDVLAKHVAAVYPLHRLLASSQFSPGEFSQVDLVALEVPPVTFTGFEHDLLRLTTQLLTTGTHVAIIVHPSLRKNTQKALGHEVELPVTCTVQVAADVFMPTWKCSARLPLYLLHWWKF